MPGGIRRSRGDPGVGSWNRGRGGLDGGGGVGGVGDGGGRWGRDTATAAPTIPPPRRFVDRAAGGPASVSGEPRPTIPPPRRFVADPGVIRVQQPGAPTPSPGNAGSPSSVTAPSESVPVPNLAVPAGGARARRRRADRGRGRGGSRGRPAAGHHAPDARLKWTDSPVRVYGWIQNSLNGNANGRGQRPQFRRQSRLQGRPVDGQPVLPRHREPAGDDRLGQLRLPHGQHVRQRLAVQLHAGPVQQGLPAQLLRRLRPLAALRRGAPADPDPRRPRRQGRASGTRSPATSRSRRSPARCCRSLTCSTTASRSATSACSRRCT